MDFLLAFRMLIEEFADLDEEILIFHLDNANSLIKKSISESIRKNMVCYLAAHNIDLSRKRKGAGGQVTAISEGKLKIDYAVNNNIKSDFDLSSYGRRYQDLLRSVIKAPMTRSI